MGYVVLIFASLVAAELLYFRIADKFDIIDKPNLRSSHTHVTLRGGGIVFLFGGWLYAAFYGLRYPWFLMGLTAIAAISFADDVRSVSNRIRLIIHLLAMLMLFRQWGILTAEMCWYVFPAWIVGTGIINAYNFMDGINGMTGCYSLAVLLPLLLVNGSEHFVDMNLICVTALSVLVFCFFNFRTRAKCFAGDVGSVGIAYMLLFMLGLLIICSGQLSYLVFLSVYGVDTVLTIIHRLLLRENIFEAHRKHAYQLMANELEIPHMTVSAFYALLQLAISAGAVYLRMNEWVYFSLIVAVLCGAYLLFFKKYYHLHETYLKSRTGL